MAPTVRIDLFATARVAVGRGHLEQEVAPGGVTARELLDHLATEFPKLRPLLRGCRFLRNDRYLTDLGQRLRPGDRFSVHPPYGGG